MVSKLITNKEQIHANYSDVFDGIGCFPGPPYHIQVDHSVTPKLTPCWLIPIHLEESFKKEIDKILQVGVLKPMNQVTPWINSFVLVGGKDKLGNLKLRICLDPTNLNKAIVHESYHFKTQEDIVHLLAEACVITVCDCRKGYWQQQLDKASSFLTTFNIELCRFQYTVMAFGATWLVMFFREILMNVLASWSKLLLSQMTSWLLGRSQTPVITTKPSLACYRQSRSAKSN